jgi:hypothetical protein
MDNKQVTAEWIAQQRERLNGLRDAPWDVEKSIDHRYHVRGPAYGTRDYVCIAGGLSRAEAEFIASARTALPAALDALEAAMRREAEKDATIARLTAEAGRISLAEEEKDTMMKRRKEQIEVIRTIIDKGGLCDVEKRLLNDLNLPSNYDRRSCTPRTEGYKDD